MKDSNLVRNEFDTHQIHNYKRLSEWIAFLFWNAFFKSSILEPKLERGIKYGKIYTCKWNVYSKDWFWNI